MLILQRLLNRICKVCSWFFLSVILLVCATTTAYAQAAVDEELTTIRHGLATTTIYQSENELRELGAQAIWINGVKNNKGPLQIRQEAVEYRARYDTLKAKAEKKYTNLTDNILLNIVNTSLAGAGAVLGGPAGGAAGAAIGNAITGFSKQQVYGELARNSRAELNTNTIVIANNKAEISKQYAEMLGSTNSARRVAACTDFANSNNGTNLCETKEAMTLETSAKGGQGPLIAEMGKLAADVKQQGAAQSAALEKVSDNMKSGFSTLNASITTNFEALNGQIDGIDQQLADSALRQKSILEGVNANNAILVSLYGIEQQRIKAQEEADRKALAKAKRKAEQRDAYAVLATSARLLTLLDPEVGAKASAIVDFTISMNDALEEFNSLRENFSDVGTAALTGDFISIGLTFLDAIGVFGSAPSSEEIILEQLQAIQSQLGDIQQSIARIDTRLSEIYGAMLGGFSDVIAGVEAVRIDVERNARLAQDTQQLLLQETNNILEEIYRTTNRVCVQQMVNSQRFADDDYARCAYLLESVSQDSVFTQEHSAADLQTETEQTLFYGENKERSTTILRDYFNLETSQNLDGRIASYNRVLSSAIFYADFLRYSPAQALLAYPETAISLSNSNAAIKNLSEFREAVLDDFSISAGSAFKQDGSNTFTETTNRSVVLRNIETAHNDFVAQFDAILARTLAEYNVDNGLVNAPLYSEIAHADDIAEFEKSSRLLFLTGPGTSINVCRRSKESEGRFGRYRTVSKILVGEEVSDGGYRPDNLENLEHEVIGRWGGFASDSVKNRYLDSLGGAYSPQTCAMVRMGLGHHVVDFVYEGAKEIKTNRSSNSVSFEVVSEQWTRYISFQFENGRTIRLKRTTATVPTNNNKRFFRTRDIDKLINTGPLGCDGYCLLKHFTQAPTPSFSQVMRNEYLAMRATIRDKFIFNLQNDAEFGKLDTDILRKTVYIAALHAFAFEGVISGSPAISEIAGFGFRYPPPKELIADLQKKDDVFRLKAYLGEQAETYRTVLASPTTQDLITARRAATEFDPVSDYIIDTPFALAMGGTTPPIEPRIGDSGGGSGGGIFGCSISGSGNALGYAGKLDVSFLLILTWLGWRTVRRRAQSY